MDSTSKSHTESFSDSSDFPDLPDSPDSSGNNGGAGELPEPWLASKITQIYDLVEAGISSASVFTLYSSLIISTSIFTYITIYSIYVPIVQHTKPMYLQFDSSCQLNCSFPYAVVNFNDRIRLSFPLSRGQSYSFFVELEMPESDINWDQGMFMIRLRLIESQGKTLYDESRPAILQFRTLVTRLIKAFIYWPFLVTNYKNEMQTINVQLIDDYIEGAKYNFNKMDRAIVELITRDIQIYSARLKIKANLKGITYYMYHWSIISAAIGISTISGFLGIMSQPLF